MYNNNQMYAYRTFKPFGAWTDGNSSAEWHEDVALELGERVSEHEFMEFMFKMYPGGPWLGHDVVVLYEEQ